LWYSAFRNTFSVLCQCAILHRSKDFVLFLIFDNYKEVAEFCYKINDEAKAIAKKQGIELHTNVQSGHKVEAIVNFAKH
jgi:hypothetical protein